ncbi:MAG: type IV pilus biogenesis/stability protein PilW [Rubrivivax sp.]|jgi:type IV pilus assembly protein PilF|nr:type IV pilus biogenesis/stability protein PilW [Rubrivivax sp.]
MSPIAVLSRVSCVWAAVLLVGCAAGPAALEAAPADLKTASDQTNADRIAQARLELAVAYFGRNQLNTALDEVKQALDARPDLPEALSLRGLIYAAMSENSLAESSFRRAAALAPGDGDNLHNYAWFLCQQRRFDEADALFARALGLPQYRSFSRTMLAQGACQARAGRLQKADATLSRAYELDPSSAAVAYNLTEVLFRLGEFERARFYIRRVNLRSETTNAQSLWLAAKVEHRLRNPPQVQALGQQLKERFPQSPEALLFEKGRFDD